MILMALGLAFTFAVLTPALSLTPFSTDQAFAKDGADDPAGDDNGGHGGDDPAGDDNGGHGGDDGPDHT
jgi:hypothetical protein